MSSLPTPLIRRDGEDVVLVEAGLRATLPGDLPVMFAHVGCKLLAAIREGLPPEIETTWNGLFGTTWRNKRRATERLGETLQRAVSEGGLDGLELWDTMRLGSDYWRPGRLLSDAARTLDATYARDDDLCPPAELLRAFRGGEPGMTFATFSARYAAHLRGDDRLPRAAAAVVRAQARGRLAVFYCVDPHIPGFGQSAPLPNPVPYAHREYLDALAAHGCHRYTLVEELARWFSAAGIASRVLSLDPTFGRIRMRDVAAR